MLATCCNGQQRNHFVIAAHDFHSRDFLMHFKRSYFDRFSVYVFVRFSRADYWFASRASAPFARPRIARTASNVASSSATCNWSPRPPPPPPQPPPLHLMHLHSPLRQTMARTLLSGIRRRRHTLPPLQRRRRCVLFLRSLPLAGRRNPGSKSRITLHCCCMMTMTFSRRSSVAAMCSRSIGCVWYASCAKIF